MNTENMTRVGVMGAQRVPSQTTQISTSVWFNQQTDNVFLSGQRPASPSVQHRTSGGLILLKCKPPVACSALFGRLLQPLPLKPYAQTLELLRQHQHTLRSRERDPFLKINLAWLSLADSTTEFNKRVLESFEIALSHSLFLETLNPQQSIDALCSEAQFDAIVVEAPATPVILKRAQRWLKPAAHDPLKPESANLLETHPRERIFICIDERRRTLP
jgi:hypothetical protein